MGDLVSFPKKGGEIGAHFEEVVQAPKVETQLKTSVSRLALALPDIFMSNKDAEKMIQMLSETRDSINGVVADDLLAANDNRKTQVATNDNNITPVKIAA